MVQDNVANYANPLFALTLWIEETAASGATAGPGFGCVYRRYDAARMPTGGSREAITAQIECLQSYTDPRNAQTPDFLGFMCRYSGEKRDSNDHCTSFDNNPNFINGVEFWYRFLSQGQPAGCQIQDVAPAP